MEKLIDILKFHMLCPLETSTFGVKEEMGAGMPLSSNTMFLDSRVCYKSVKLLVSRVAVT